MTKGISVDRQISLKMGEICRKKIYQRARAVLKNFGETHTEERSDHMRSSSKLSVELPEGVLVIRAHSFGQFHENNQIDIWFDGDRVFSAVQTAFKESYDPRLILRFNRNRNIAIELFNSGDWTKCLNSQKITRALQPKLKKESKPEAPKPIRESDDQIAARFRLWSW